MPLVPHRPLIPILFALASAAFASPTPEAIELAQHAFDQIAAYHADAPTQANSIRVVYFHPRDQRAFPDWRERTSRAIEDISQFYAAQLQAYGLPFQSLPFERDAKGQLVIHRVKSKHPSNGYAYESGNEIEKEIRKALGRKIDFDRVHVLAIHALCEKATDGSYTFHAPYYGSGNQMRGFSHVSGSDLIDPELLTETNRTIRYFDYDHPDVAQTKTLAEFNSIYLGGIAHELGHAMGLMHDNGGRIDRGQPGSSLMGRGSLNYREDRRGEDGGAYLSAGSVLRLISSPLLTQSGLDRFTAPETELAALQFSQSGDVVSASGTIKSDVPAYAVVAHLWRPQTWPGDPKQDHHSATQPVLVKDSQFRFEGGGLPPGDYRLHLTALHLNGAAKDFDFHLKIDEQGQSNVASLNERFAIRRAVAALVSNNQALARQLLDSTTIATPEALREQAVLREILSPPEPIDLSRTDRTSLSLSDAQWLEAQVGWGSPARNHYAIDALDPGKKHNVFLSLNGQVHDKGLYAHSKSRYAYDLDRRWKRFTAKAGLQSEAYDIASAVFIVKGDGRELYRSPVLRAGQSETIDIDLSQIATLELIVQGGEGHINGSWAIWADPIVQR